MVFNSITRNMVRGCFVLMSTLLAKASFVSNGNHTALFQRLNVFRKQSQEQLNDFSAKIQC